MQRFGRHERNQVYRLWGELLSLKLQRQKTLPPCDLVSVTPPQFDLSFRRTLQTQIFSSSSLRVVWASVPPSLTRNQCLRGD